MQSMISHFIDGQHVTDENANTLPIYDPAQGEVIHAVQVADKKMVNHTVEVAKRAQIEWQKVSAVKRARVFFKFKAHLEDRQEEIIATITKEHGKTLADAKGELQRAIEVVEFACGAPSLLKADFSENVAQDVDSFNIRQPLGVCLGVTPFNFPMMVPLWMIPVALVCGNSFILKPSEKTPSAALMIATLLQASGLPDGVFNVVQGDKQTVNDLLTHPCIDGVSFVGSTPVAKHIFETATSKHKRVQALSGAKNHCVVMPDADIEQVAHGLIGAAFGSCGQRCMAISVVVAVTDEVGDQLIKSLTPKIQALKVGHGMQVDTDMGPLISSAQKQNLHHAIDAGIKAGATCVVDGRALKVQEYPTGFFIGPTLFDHVSPDMSVYQHELFGPILCVLRVKEANEALQLVNEHPFGNGAIIYTNNGLAAREFAQNVQSGMVGINVPLPVPMAFHSFGGWKQSLFGDHHMHGMEGIRFYTRLKTVSSRWLTQTEIKMSFV